MILEWFFMQPPLKSFVRESNPTKMCIIALNPPALKEFLLKIEDWSPAQQRCAGLGVRRQSGLRN
jgi:hypothetical protein